MCTLLLCADALAAAANHCAPCAAALADGKGGKPAAGGRAPPERPQDSFPCPVDNSNTPWRPRVEHLKGLTATPLDLELYRTSKDAGVCMRAWVTDAALDVRHAC